MCLLCKLGKGLNQTGAMKVAQAELKAGTDPEHVSDILAKILGEDLKDRDYGADAAWERANHSDD